MSDPLVSGIGVCPGVVRGEAESPTFREGYRGATARQNHCHPAQFSVICGSSNECFGSDL